MDRPLLTIEERYAAEPALVDAVTNLQEAWMALKAIRAALGQFGPVREPEDPDFNGEAKVLVEAIWREASSRKPSS
jgi:hypothetical protein